MSNVTIIGGGNMGSVLAIKFSQKHNVTLFLNSPYEVKENYSKGMLLFNEDCNKYVKGKIKIITEDLKEATENAEWIFITYPSFLFSSFSKELLPILRSGQHLVGIPGSGGFELFFKEALKKGVTITGLQRVHSVARFMNPGKEVRESGVRKAIRCASIPSSFNIEASVFLSDCYGLPVEQLDNYLNITLINSNPILHTSRLFTIFKDYEKGVEYERLPLFYEEWSFESSVLLEKMDDELFSMIDVLNKNKVIVDQVVPLLQHYESSNADEMTRKLTSINSLKGLTTPSIKTSNECYIPDLKSRYFTADFPLGLDILIAFSKVLGVECNNMKMVSNWYHKITNTDFVFKLSDFKISSISDIKEYYCL